MIGIKESLELATALKVIGQQALLASEDGKIGLGDLQFAPAIVQAFHKAVDGVTQIPAELADLDVSEAKALAVAYVEAGVLLAQAYKQVRSSLQS